MPTTSPDGISYPSNTSSKKTIEAHIQDTATSVQTALTSNRSALETSIAAVPSSPNYIINGGMDIWQRGTSGTVGGSVGFAADRWQSLTYAGGTMYWFQQSAVSNPSGTRYCTRVQRASGATNTATTNLAYSFETTDVLDMAGKTMTLSYYIRAGANYSPTGSVFNHAVTWGTGTDQAVFTGSGITGGGDIFRSSVTLTTSWQRITVTFTVPSAATSLGISLYSGTNVGTAGAADYWDITGVQLERGSVATIFRRNQPNTQSELAACQRYCYVKNGSTTDAMWGWGRWESNSFYCVFQHPVQMRVPPAFTLLTPSGLQAVDPTVAWYNVTGITTIHKNGTYASDVLLSTSGASVTNKTFGVLAVNSGSPRLIVSSEL